MQEVETMTAEQLEPERLTGTNRRYCQSCQKVLDIEKRKGWPAEPGLSLADKDFIREHWAQHSAREIATMLGRTVYERIGEWGSAYCPPKEHNAGRFRKGDIPATAKPDVSETLRTDKRGVQYWHVRGGQYGWMPKHVALWEAIHGPVPKGKVVAFKDKNTLNCVLENLEILDRSQHLGRNSGRDELTDKYVSSQLARTSGQRGQHIDREMQQEVLQVPELLEVKRNQLRLNRALKATTQS
jgi:hypothetical protein